MRTKRGTAIVILLGLCTLAGGDPYGGRGYLWNYYFETDPRLRELYGTRDIPPGDRERCEAARELLTFPGGPGPAVEGAGGGAACPANVIAVLPGSVPGAIIVSAHLDRAGTGEGAVDDFSGVVMLGMLYTYFYERYHRHDLVFAAFDGEETGLKGLPAVHRVKPEHAGGGHSRHQPRVPRRRVSPLLGGGVVGVAGRDPDPGGKTEQGR